MKKKLFSVVLCLSVLMSLVACGKDKKSEAAMALDEKIQSIGVVTLDSGELIAEIEQGYMQLSDKEKEQLEYYQSYVTAKESYEKLLSEEQTKETEKQELVTEIESLIEDNESSAALDKINEIDDAKLKAEIETKLREKCYCDIDLIKFNEVVSMKSDSSKEDTDEGDRRFSYYYYSIASDIQSAFDEYNLYLSANCEKTGSQNQLATSYNYTLNGKEITIMLYSTAVDGKYMLQISYYK
ncbi:MAG: hypothetical protein J6J16_09075 [Lachnospiraceae bacterium]|nr:hypothetical protein [Lachnospiraceae bacterium]